MGDSGGNVDAHTNESRLDRLLKLVDSAPSSAFRRLAAKQLGQVIGRNEAQCRNLLLLLEPVLFSKNWDSRIAAGYAIEYAFKEMKVKKENDSLIGDNSGCEEGLLKELDLRTEISSRRALLASAGSEFDLDLTISAAERLKISRANVKKSLGLMEGVAGMDELERELVKDEDLNVQQSLESTLKLTTEPVKDLSEMSARERSMMKRKARMANQNKPVKQGRKDSSFVELSRTGSADTLNNTVNANTNINDNYLDGIADDAVWLCELMKEKLLNPNWQCRHGALLGLRAVLSSDRQGPFNTAWMELLLADLLLVLGLDRFGDFIGDQVVSPVKETAAQTFALLLRNRRAANDELESLLIGKHLRVLLEFDQWQVRHGGLLALKYLLVSRNDLVSVVASELGSCIVGLLEDLDEDVRAVAASVLSLLLDCQVSIDYEQVMNILKDIFMELEDLSPSLPCLMDLLMKIKEKSVIEFPVKLVLPFLRNSSSKVRMQTVQVLGKIMTGEANDLVTVCRLLFQSMAVEMLPEISNETLKLWKSIRIPRLPDSLLFDSFLTIVLTPIGSPYDRKLFVFPGGAPPDHELAFKAADMMLIGEEEALRQRMNCARALASIVNEEGLERMLKERIYPSKWNCHHLVGRWLGCDDNNEIKRPTLFNEEINAWNTLTMEYSKLIGQSNKQVSIDEIQKGLSDALTSSSIEIVNSAKSVQGAFDACKEVHERLTGRFEAAYANTKNTTILLEESRKLIDQIRFDGSTVLQTYFAEELVSKFMSMMVIEIDDFKQMIFDLTKLVDRRLLLGERNGMNLHSERTWLEYGGCVDSEGGIVWRGGQLIVKSLIELGDLVLIGKVKDVLINELNKQGIGKDLESEEIVVLALGLLASMSHWTKSKEVTDLLLNDSDHLFALLLSNFISSSTVMVSSITAMTIGFWCNLQMSELKNFSLIERVLIDVVLPCMNQKTNVRAALRLVLELLTRIEEQLIIPVVPVMLVAVMGWVNESEEEVRIAASVAFSQLIKLAPLSADGQEEVDLSKILRMEVIKAQEFLDQLRSPSTSCPDYTPPCPLNVSLRSYQQAGLNWLAFLRKYQLHGALCDDMGLGKTVQTLCIIASDHFEQKGRRMRSLIVCPASLTGHWQAELRQYCPSLEDPLVYIGSAQDRRHQLLGKLPNAEIVITSYEVLRADIDAFNMLHWNYCVLDEGHLIKNPKAKVTQAVKSLKAQHRLILSGTPIQNNLLELWSLFDFLLPGYLGSEREFHERYAKPIAALQHQQSNNGNNGNGQASSSSKWTQRDFDEAEAKLASLHKQVLPFILRRMKEDVLKDLPPKIIQDYTCEMSPVQRIIYDDLLGSRAMREEIADFINSKAGKPVEEEKEKDKERTKNGSTMHVFQVLQYLRKLCIHPELVLTSDHPLKPMIDNELVKASLTMNDLSVSPKLQMLKELLVECGIGGGEADFDNSTGHRVLIFAQHKTSLDLIERLVFKPNFPRLSFLRLDGSVDVHSRYPIVHKFNNDPSIEVLLLTTHVGGLGLNLTSADTVIFLDPDWNPMKDLQAMDRAHRLGQKRVVTVYRLLLKDSLEERIMGLQRWKMLVAGTVVTQQNASMTTMNTGNLLDLFEEHRVGEGTIEQQKEKESNAASMTGSAAEKWLKSHGAGTGLSGIGNEDDPESEYAREFDLAGFSL